MNGGFTLKLVKSKEDGSCLFNSVSISLKAECIDHIYVRYTWDCLPRTVYRHWLMQPWKLTYSSRESYSGAILPQIVQHTDATEDCLDGQMVLPCVIYLWLHSIPIPSKSPQSSLILKGRGCFCGKQTTLLNDIYDGNISKYMTTYE